MADIEEIENTESVLPFEPLVRVNDEEESDDGWETMDSDSDVEQGLVGGERNQKEADEWCLCQHCQQMQTSVECICCKEVDETKSMLVSNNLGTGSTSTPAFLVFLCFLTKHKKTRSAGTSFGTGLLSSFYISWERGWYCCRIDTPLWQPRYQASCFLRK